MNFKGYDFDPVGDGVHNPIRQCPIELPDGRTNNKIAARYYARRGNMRRFNTIGSHVIERETPSSLISHASNMSQMGRGKKKNMKKKQKQGSKMKKIF